jgi:cytochrome P450/NADPH-cytochrome P450 reductase
VAFFFPRIAQGFSAPYPEGYQVSITIPRVPLPELMECLSNSDGPLSVAEQLSQRYGEIFQLRTPQGRMTIVSSFRLFDELCDTRRFDKVVEGALLDMRELGGDGLFTVDTDHPNWSRARHVLLPALSPGAVRAYLPTMAVVARRLIARWQRLSPEEVIEVGPEMTSVTLDTIGLCGFNYDFECLLETRPHPLIESLSRVFEQNRERMRAGRSNPEIDAQRKSDVQNIQRIVDDVIGQRQQQTGCPRDLLQTMLERPDPISGEFLSEENVRNQIVTFLIAGHETTSGLLAFTLHALGQHPQVLKRVRQEVDRVLGEDLQTDPDITQIQELSYLRQVLLESLRLWPTVPSLAVAPREDTHIGGEGYPLPKGSIVKALLTQIQRDPAIWGPKPDEFWPAHFETAAVAGRPANAYKPFGNGHRSCLGRAFALNEASLVLAMLVQRFNFNPVDDQLRIRSTLSIQPEQFKIRVSPRRR